MSAATMAVRMNTAMRCIALMLLVLPYLVSSLAGTASKKRSNKGKGSSGTGFGAKKEAWRLHTSDTSPETASLLDFLTKQKASIANTEIGINESGQRSIYATKNFKEGDLICKIPSDYALALSDPAKEGEDAPTLAHGGLGFLKMYWKNPQGRKVWAPYLDTLPTDPGTAKTPNMFADDEIDLLEFPRLMERSRQRQQEIKDVAATTDEFTEEELEFATWLVSTRAFPIQLTTEENGDAALDEKGRVLAKADRKWIRVMVPYIDIVNHASVPNAALTLIDPEKDEAWFALKATRPIPQGREVNTCYGSGADSSVELLLNFGFVPQENKIDTLMLRKGGDDCIADPSGWTTTLEEDESMFGMTTDEDVNLRKILGFRIKMKKAYAEA